MVSQAFPVKNKATGESLSCFIDTNGSVHIGLDTYRLGNKADYPSYQFKSYPCWKSASNHYLREEVS